MSEIGQVQLELVVTTMSERAAELWERGQELDDSAEELWESIIERNKRLDWERLSLAGRESQQTS